MQSSAVLVASYMYAHARNSSCITDMNMLIAMNIVTLKSHAITNSIISCIPTYLKGCTPGLTQVKSLHIDGTI